MLRVAINGFGRIGRTALRLLENDKDIEVVAINDLTDPVQLAYLYKYDSVHRTNKSKISFDSDELIVKNKKIKVFAEMDPSKLPWKALGVDIVLECTGVFTSKEKCKAHLDAGAKHVIISAPAKDEVKTIVYGVNHNILNKSDEVISAASCTTNCLAPVLKLINDKFIIKEGFMTTVHAITNDQETLDIPHKKGIMARRGRAASLNIIPTSTGAASQIGKVIPSLKGKMDGLAFRVPVGDGSVIDVTLELEKSVTKESVNNMFKSNQSKCLKYTEDPIVSCDIIGEEVGATVDGLLTNIVESDGKQLLKVVAWYDNEVGYTAQMIRTMKLFM
ncbi:glyceraldehyde 3-phosphate dehydrogenase [Clostridium sp. CAG:1000]|jgi:glyceraldehyde 3-phosphate dehydrogenase|nr:glyceraldehyde 3-phosphate dehydrogenase [Clostridium sp. CAG:1000]